MIYKIINIDKNKLNQPFSYPLTLNAAYIVIKKM